MTMAAELTGSETIAAPGRALDRGSDGYQFGVEFTSTQFQALDEMGFGSYDESEQGNHEIDTDIDETEEGGLSSHEGSVEFEYDDATTEDLLEQFEEMRD